MPRSNSYAPKSNDSGDGAIVLAKRVLDAYLDQTNQRSALV